MRWRMGISSFAIAERCSLPVVQASVLISTEASVRISAADPDVSQCAFADEPGDRIFQTVGTKI